MIADHLAQNRHNERVCDLISSQTPSFLDWEITTLFYAALHLINHRLLDLGYTVSGHGKRMAAVKDHLPDMHDPFHTLYVLSIRARYVGVDAIKPVDATSARRAYEQLLQN